MSTSRTPRLTTKGNHYQKWQGRFGEFVRAYGVRNLSTALGVHTTAVYNWVEGRNYVLPRHARKIVELSMTSTLPLSLEDVFNHKEKANAAGRGR